MAEDARPVTHRNPYPGLRPFRPDEEHLFFGREQQVDRMIDKLAAHRFLAVVGGSGSGKSSLVNCGLRPALHRGYMASGGSAWRMAQFRPGNDPIGALARSLALPGVLFDAPASGAVAAETLVESTLRLGSLGLVDIVDQADLVPGTQLIVVADQFEELFRFRALIPGAHQEGWSPAEDAVGFVRLLLEAAAQTDLPIHIVLTMRSDFLGDCAQFLGLPEAINDGQYLVPRLTRDEIRAAITGPAHVRGAAISPVLVTRLLNDVGDNPDQLSILQHALNRTWAAWEKSAASPQGPIDLHHYESIGGMSQALDLHAERAFGQVGDEARQRLCERVFKALTDTGTDPRGTRRPLTLATLVDITGATEAELRAVLEVFRKPTRSFLMPPLPEELHPNRVIDISHESLMRVWKRLKAWADEEAQSARSYRHLREAADQFDQGRQSLLRDPELQVLLDWEAKNRPGRAWAELYGGGFEAAKTFLDRSLAARTEQRIEAETERRWQARERFAPVALAFVIFVVLQAWFADGLEAWLSAAQWFGPRWSGRVSQGLGHVLAGMPAALAYLGLSEYLSPVLRRRVRARVLADMAGPGETVATAAPEAPRADIGALGHGSFPRRASAQLVDWLACVLIAAVQAILMLLILTPFVAPAPPDGTRADSAAFAAETSQAGDILFTAIFVTWVVWFWFYHARSWTSKHRATWGMRIAGLQVTDLEGRRLGWGRATGRFLARIVSYYTLGIGFLIQPFSAKGQTLHDRLSGTLVLNRSPRRNA